MLFVLEISFLKREYAEMTPYYIRESDKIFVIKTENFQTFMIQLTAYSLHI